MRNLHRALLSGSLSLAVVFVGGCGGGAGLLSGNQAGTLQNQLNKISSELSAGHCANVRQATRTLVDEVASLPSTLNGNLRQDLDRGASQVSALAVQQCRPPRTQTTPTQTTPTTTTATTPTPTTTTTAPPTSTTTTPTTPTTPATTPTTPGNNNGSSGGGGLSGGSAGSGDAGNGNGNG